MIWNEDLLAKALEQEIGFKFSADYFEFNSKYVKPGSIFIALKGESGDGHTYIQNAIDNGAVCIISEKPFSGFANVVVVENTHKALYKMAGYKRSNVNAIYVGVTGSVGKTSTKEMLAAFFSAYGKTFKTEGNFNNDLGVPITLCRMPLDSEYAVIEMGMSSKGEIKTLTDIVNPKICIITNVEAVHLEFFDSVAGIADAKSEIFMGSDKTRTAIINIDSPYYEQMHSNAIKCNIDKNNIHTFGKHASASVRLVSCNIQDSEMHIEAAYHNNIYKFSIPLVGEHHAINALIAICSAASLSLNIDAGINNIKNMHIAKGRGEVIDITCNSKTFTIVNEAYNASPVATKAVLKAYATKYSNRRLIAVLGDMKELGAKAADFHKDLSHDIENNKIAKVICVGALMKNLYDAIPDNKKLGYYFNIDEMLNSDIINLIEDKDVIIIKGSNSMKLFKLAEYFKTLETR